MLLRKVKHEMEMESTILSWLIREGLDAKVTTEPRHAGEE